MIVFLGVKKVEMGSDRDVQDHYWFRELNRSSIRNSWYRFNYLGKKIFRKSE